MTTWAFFYCHGGLTDDEKIKSLQIWSCLRHTKCSPVRGLKGQRNGRMNHQRSAVWIDTYKDGRGERQQRSDMKEKESGGER